MIKVSVMYPNGSGTRFDMKYYLNRHIPLVRQLLGTALRQVAVEQGIVGPQPGSPPTYIALGHLWFDSVEDFQSGLGKHGQQIMGDIPNYTNVQPIIQISEVKL
jgi:uncharacterized protein (TIGR02118 family)